MHDLTPLPLCEHLPPVYISLSVLICLCVMCMCVSNDAVGHDRRWHLLLMLTPSAQGGPRGRAPGKEN